MKNDKPNILVISKTNLHKDTRIRRQIKSLKENYYVITIAVESSGLEDEYFPVLYIDNGFINKIIKIFKILIRQEKSRYWYKVCKKNYFKYKGKIKNIDVVLLNEIELYHLGVMYRNAFKIPMICDLHEFYPRNFEDKIIWMFIYNRYFTSIIRESTKYVSKYITVSEGISGIYKREFGIECDIIENKVAYAENIKPGVIANNRINYIYHGAANGSRSLDVLINAFKQVTNDKTLTLMLVGNATEMKPLKKLAKGHSNINFTEPVKVDEVIETANLYDVGIVFYPWKSINLKYALPNKLFEYIQSRIAILIGPSPDMINIVKKYRIGIVTEDFTLKSLINEINLLTPDKLKMLKRNTNIAAYELAYKTDSFSSIVSNLL